MGTLSRILFSPTEMEVHVFFFFWGEGGLMTSAPKNRVKTRT